MFCDIIYTVVRKARKKRVVRCEALHEHSDILRRTER